MVLCFNHLKNRSKTFIIFRPDEFNFGRSGCFSHYNLTGSGVERKCFNQLKTFVLKCFAGRNDKITRNSHNLRLSLTGNPIEILSVNSYTGVNKWIPACPKDRQQVIQECRFTGILGIPGNKCGFILKLLQQVRLDMFVVKDQVKVFCYKLNVYKS